MSTFELNFNGQKKSVKVKLEKSEDIFLLAEAFSKWLTKNKIPNTLTEHQINEDQESKNQRN